jgi:RNA polymerase sigma-70 factor, ECF subfamily
MTPEQFNDLFRAQLVEITRFIARRVPESEVEDIAADLFEIAWAKRAQIPEGLELAWLYKSARYLISNHRRKSENRRRITSLLTEPVSAPSAESIALADAELADAWKQLTIQEREVLALWAFDGLTANELATTLEVSVNNVNVRLSRARKHLAEILRVAVN